MFVESRHSDKHPLFVGSIQSAAHPTKRIARNGDYKVPIFVGRKFDLVSD
jgi:hypothetical protein